MFKKRYKNPHVKDIKKRLVDIVWWQVGGYKDALPPPRPPKGFSYPNPSERLDEMEPQITWINHCTFLIEVDGFRILTDPIWGKRCSPFRFFGPKRHHAPAISIEDLPEIDACVVSHDHYDHLCSKSVKKLKERFPNMLWLVPVGLERWFHRRGIYNVNEHHWWQHSVVDSKALKITATAVPCQHFSGRGGWHQNNTLWAGWVLDFKRGNKKSKRLYFVGDTGYNPVDFKRIGDRFSDIDLSLIPIGTYVPHEFMAPVHIDPDKAVQIHKDVKSKLSLGMHWKTFCLSGEGMEQPPYDLYLSLAESNINPLAFRVVDPGQTINW
ncbi:MAG: MBL fold metallo-hydrolase [Simkaniaceae bacterium]|nr:MBL fold metallo-hydrolase [Simkaniaceae bacterium]